MKKYVARFYCVSCKGVLSWVQIMGSHGVCPLCGKVTDSSIVGHKKEPALVWVNDKKDPRRGFLARVFPCFFGSP